MASVVRRLANAHEAVTGGHETVYAGRDADGRHLFSDATVTGDREAMLHMLMIHMEAIVSLVRAEMDDTRDYYPLSHLRAAQSSLRDLVQESDPWEMRG